ncbi:DedD protein [Ectothiorhodosinus mongolicus]|uniref:DedD protein n=1 Tax=Ectothiorhodosinus mongolicus TaxID=233100 RepID=A0A1R3VQ01_9GAMM|nr:SPOR domain-containing protein [Ectothiorhodosinus mongolicus]SIT66030.1 DedD protein [Ectothiorhodosinus mongolicus]
MDESLKQRLLGAAVLVALAVIFLPVLLDGAGREAHLDMQRMLPAEPVFERPEVRPSNPPATASTPATPAPTDSAASSSTATSESAATASVEAARPAPRAELRAVPLDAPVGEGFVVQVGSFSREDNARSEAERLIQAGFNAFVERSQADGNAVYRVKVGPEAERRGAERVQARLQSRAGVSGIIVAHP